MTTVMASLTPESRKDECIKHALAVRAAWALNNYHSFFQLYQNAPKMSGYLMDWFAERARKSALKAIIMSYVHAVLPFRGSMQIVGLLVALSLSIFLSVPLLLIWVEYGLQSK